MAEVWRELPDGINVNGSWAVLFANKQTQGISVGFRIEHHIIVCFDRENPADALIELWVWLEKEKLRETEAVKKDPVIDKNSAAYMDN